MPIRSSKTLGSKRLVLKLPGAGGIASAAGAAAQVRAFLPAAALAYALLGEPGAALTAAAAWALSLAGEAWPRGRARPDPGPGVLGVPSTPAACPDRPAPGYFTFRQLPRAGLVFASFLTVFLASDLLRGSLSGRSAFLDSIQSALTCSVLLLPLGLPAAAVFLRGGTGRAGFPRVEEFQLACCAGMSLAEAGAVLAGWIPPLSIGQLLWANAVGTALPSRALARASGSAGPGAPAAGERSVRIVPDVLVPGLLLAVLLLALYRVGLADTGDAPRAVDRARSLVFLAICLIQAAEPLAGLRKSPKAGSLRTRARELGTTLGGFLAALAPAAVVFLVPAARAFLGLTVPEPTAAAAALAAAGTYLGLRVAAGKALRDFPRETVRP